MHMKYVVKIMYCFNMAAIFVIFSIVITIHSGFDLETLFIIYMCAVVGHVTSLGDKQKLLYLSSLLEFLN